MGGGGEQGCYCIKNQREASGCLLFLPCPPGSEQSPPPVSAAGRPAPLRSPPSRPRCAATSPSHSAVPPSTAPRLKDRDNKLVTWCFLPSTALVTWCFLPSTALVTWCFLPSTALVTWCFLPSTSPWLNDTDNELVTCCFLPSTAPQLKDRDNELVTWCFTPSTAPQLKDRDNQTSK